MAETIREFIVGLGWNIDAASERRFVSAVEGATLRAKLLGDAIELMAATVVDKVGQVATQFEQLFYQSQRVGASANSIRAFQYAIGQLGGTVEGANSALEGFGEFLRNTPHAAEAIARQLKIPLADTKDTAEFLIDIGERLSHMPTYLANQYRDAYHLGDQQTMFALERSAELRRRYEESLKSQGEAGITGQAMKNATQFEQAWREVWQRIGNMAEGGESKLFTGLTEPMKKFNKWLDDHQPQLDGVIGKISGSLDHLAEQWTVDAAKLVFGEDQTKGINDAADAIAHFVDKLDPLIADLEKLDTWFRGSAIGRFMNSAAGGSLVNPLPSGPGFFASHGPGVGASGLFGGIGHWLGGLFGGGGGSILQNGVPVSDSNPLSVKVAGVSGGGGFWSGIWNGISGMFGGGGGGAPPGIRARGAGPYNYQDAPNAGELTKLITAEAKRAGIDPRLMEGIRAGESLHGSRYDIKDDATESSWGPFQLNRRSGLGVQFEHDTGLDLRDPKTIPAQARWVAEYIKRTGNLSPWRGYHGPREADPRWGDSGYIPAKKFAPLASSPLNWDVGPAWSAINGSLPVGASNNSSKNVTVGGTTNTINVYSSDPQSAAAMVGVHLDRSANDVSRNLQGAFQ